MLEYRRGAGGAGGGAGAAGGAPRRGGAKVAPRVPVTVTRAVRLRDACKAWRKSYTCA